MLKCFIVDEFNSHAQRQRLPLAPGAAPPAPGALDPHRRFPGALDTRPRFPGALDPRCPCSPVGSCVRHVWAKELFGSACVCALEAELPEVL